MVNIYLITNLITKKQYVGKTIKSLSHRFNQHCNNNNNKNCYLHQAINKYGRENFRIELLECVEDIEWQEKEKFYIKTLKAHYSQGGYNISWGGDYNPMDDPIARQHHQEAMNKVPRERFQTFKGRTHTKESIEKQIASYKLRYNEDVEFRERCNRGSKLRREPIYEIDADGNIIQEFESLKAALQFKNHFRLTDAGMLKQAADKFNKNGTRRKYLGSYWSTKNKV